MESWNEKVALILKRSSSFITLMNVKLIITIILFLSITKITVCEKSKSTLKEFVSSINSTTRFSKRTEKIDTIYYNKEGAKVHCLINIEVTKLDEFLGFSRIAWVYCSNHRKYRNCFDSVNLYFLKDKLRHLVLKRNSLIADSSSNSNVEVVSINAEN